MRHFSLPLAALTDTSEAGSSLAVAVPGGGYIERIDYYPGTITSDTGTTITVTETFNGVANTVFSKANPGTSNVRYYPRVLEQLGSDGSDLSTHTRHFIAGSLKFTVAGGGTGKTGTVIVHVSDA